MRHRPTEPGIVGLSPTRIILVLHCVTAEKRNVPQCSKRILLSWSWVPRRCACPEKTCLGGIMEYFQEPTLSEESQMCQKNARQLCALARTAQEEALCPATSVPESQRRLKIFEAIYSTTTAFSKVPSNFVSPRKKRCCKGEYFHCSHC